MEGQGQQRLQSAEAAGQQLQHILSGLVSALATSWIAEQLISSSRKTLSTAPILPERKSRRVMHGRWKRRKDGTLTHTCITQGARGVEKKTMAVQSQECEGYVLYWLYNLTTLHSLSMARMFLRQAEAPEDATLQNLYGYDLPWRSMRHAVHVYSVEYLISRQHAMNRSKLEAHAKRKHIKALRAATSSCPPRLSRSKPGLLPEAVPSLPLCPSISVRVITVVTTAALPWLTGTSINPLLRAAYLERLEHVKVILMIPWLEASDQVIVYPKHLVFPHPALQETYIRTWLLERLNLEARFRILFYPARFDVEKNSIFPSGGFDLTGLVPKADADIAVLEEPEHLCWYHFGPKWRRVFRLVIGVVHTNYVEYVRRQPVDQGGGPMLAFLLWFVNVWRTRANCHVAIRLSEGVQYYANAVVCNIHGVAPQFLSVPSRMRTFGQNDSATVTASAPTLAPSASESREECEFKGSEQTESSGGEGLVGDELPLVFDKGCYFIGKMLWAKGYRELCDLLHEHCARQRGEEASPPGAKKRRLFKLPFRVRPAETKRRGGTGFYQKDRDIGLEAIREASGDGSALGRKGAATEDGLAHSHPLGDRRAGLGDGESKLGVNSLRMNGLVKAPVEDEETQAFVGPYDHGRLPHMNGWEDSGLEPSIRTRSPSEEGSPGYTGVNTGEGGASVRAPFIRAQVGDDAAEDDWGLSRQTAHEGASRGSLKAHVNGLEAHGAAVTSADVIKGGRGEAGGLGGDPAIEVDCFGTGGEEDEIFDFVDKNHLPVTFHGRRDHADSSIWGYKVFVNPSCSDVLCTTTAEALAMGKFVVIADHPSNIFFAEHFPENAVLYDPDVPEEFSLALRRALAGHPAPLTPAQRRMLTWEAATERFMSVAKLL